LTFFGRYLAALNGYVQELRDGLAADKQSRKEKGGILERIRLKKTSTLQL
jgi:hypothetical protein